MRITRGLIAAITRFEEREVSNEMQLGNPPTCLACGCVHGLVTPLCDNCAREFVREAAIIIDNIEEP